MTVYESTEISAERLRWIFSEEREKLRKVQEVITLETVETELQKAHESLECADKNPESETEERVKTGRRDTRKLARNLRNGEVTPIHIPTRRDE